MAGAEVVAWLTTHLATTRLIAVSGYARPDDVAPAWEATSRNHPLVPDFERVMRAPWLHPRFIPALERAEMTRE